MWLFYHFTCVSGCGFYKWNRFSHELTHVLILCLYNSQMPKVEDKEMKVKFTKWETCLWAPCHESMSGSGGLDHCICSFSTRWIWVVSFTSDWRPAVPDNRRVGAAQSWFGHRLWRREKVLCMLGHFYLFDLDLLTSKIWIHPLNE